MPYITNTYDHICKIATGYVRPGFQPGHKIAQGTEGYVRRHPTWSDVVTKLSNTGEGGS